MISLEAQRAVVLIFAMEDCPACESYIPRVVAEIQALNGQLAAQGTSFVVNPETQPEPGTVPVFLYDAASPDPEVQKLADRFGVTATPTTVVAARGTGAFKAEGSLANNQIQWILMMAAEVSKR